MTSSTTATGPYHDLSFDEIIYIHEVALANYPDVSRGYTSKGLIESIAQRPSQKHFNREHFPDIYRKCASLMEAIIKWHPFTDGNKRTGLLAASRYMRKNNCILVTPVDSIRFTVLIARDERSFEDIVKWVKTHTAHNDVEGEYDRKFQEYVAKPVDEILSVLFYNKTKDPASIEKAKATLDEWLAVDIYPQYKMQAKETIQFLTGHLMKYAPPSSAPPPPPTPPPPPQPPQEEE